MDKEYTRLQFQQVFHIENIITLFYMELKKEFSYAGESHDFWEMVYIDKGEMICTAGKHRFTLKSGELTFHKPNEFHNLAGNNRDFPNVSVITFDCSDACMDYFDGRIFKLNRQEKSLLSRLFQEGISCFELEDPTNPLLQKINYKKTAPFGSSQATKNLMELFLIELYRSGFTATKTDRINYLVNGQDIPGQVKTLLDYMESHVQDKVTVKELSQLIHASESQTKKLFSRYYDGGLINYFNSRKIHEARKLIREEQMNMAQIAEHLGFDSPQYFTRCFKKYTNMTPGEYKKSIL